MNQLDYIALARKRNIACFVKDDLPENITIAFEDAFAVGREAWNVWSACLTKSHSNKSIDELTSLIHDKFTPLDNLFYPYFLIILDARTAHDGTVLLVHRDPANEPDEEYDIRTTAATLPALLSLIDGNLSKSIPDIFANDRPPELEGANAWVYDVPLDYSSTSSCARVPVSECSRAPGASADFVRLRLDKDRIRALGFPAVDVEQVRFGEPLSSILLQCTWANKRLGERHVTGEML